MSDYVSRRKILKTIGGFGIGVTAVGVGSLPLTLDFNANPAKAQTKQALNGLHWHTGIVPAETTSVNAGAGFGSVTTLHTVGKDYIYWLSTQMKCASAPVEERIIVRLYYPTGSPKDLPPADKLVANEWAEFIGWCQGIGINNFIVLNELDVEYPGLDPNYMADLATQIRAQSDQSKKVWLGFPGPSGNTPAGSEEWNNYWNRYESVINNNYDNMALHAYGINLNDLKNNTKNQAEYVHTRFANKVQRFTEYGIELRHYKGDRSKRANDYASYVNWVRSTFSYIWGIYAWVSAGSPQFSQYEMTNDEAAIFTNKLGC
ncbi:MAG: hypothetical protein ACFCUV_04315 [Rivularia sp. (in: cyanobacteria)]